MRVHLLAAAAILLSASLAAHADTENFIFTDASGVGVSSVAGYLTIDTADRTVTSGDFAVDSTLGDYTFNSVPGQMIADGVDYIAVFTDSEGVVDLFFPTVSLIDYTGGDISTLSAKLTEDDTDNSFVNFTATLVPAATPEPSSFVLLGTGMLGVAGALRRRLV